MYLGMPVGQLWDEENTYLIGVADRLKKAGLDKISTHMLEGPIAEILQEQALGAGCILTGGASKMAGLLEVAESLLRVPARIGSPVKVSRMPEELAEPECAVLVGMLLYSHRTGVLRAAEVGGLRAKLKAMFAGLGT